jgi:hypothetical protein
MCVRDIEFTYLLTFFHFIIGYEKEPDELQLLNKNKNMVVIVFRN